MAARWSTRSPSAGSALRRTRPCCRRRAPAFSGYRLLREYFSFPERFLFVALEVCGRRSRPRKAPCWSSPCCSTRADPALEEGAVERGPGPVRHAGDQSVRALAEPARIDRRQRDIHLVADRLRPLDFEVHSLLAGRATARPAPTIFRPLYALAHPDDKAAGGAYYTLERRQRLATEQESARAPSAPGGATRGRLDAVRLWWRRAVSGAGRRQRAALARGHRPAACQGALHATATCPCSCR